MLLGDLWMLKQNIFTNMRTRRTLKCKWNLEAVTREGDGLRCCRLSSNSTQMSEQEMWMWVVKQFSAMRFQALIRTHGKEFGLLFTTIVSSDLVIQEMEYRYAVEKVRESCGDKSHLSRINLKRTFAMCVTAAVVTPTSMMWFPFLNTLMMTHMSHLAPGSGRYVFTKYCLETLVIAAPWCASFLYIPPLVEEGWSSEVLAAQSAQFLPTLKTDCLYWSVFSPINYKFVPIKFQPSYSIVMGAIEAAGLTYVSHNPKFKWPSWLE